MAISAIRVWEQNRLSSHKVQIQDFDLKFVKNEETRRAAIRSAANGGDVIENDVDLRLSPPKKPLEPRVLFSDATFEGILKHFEDGWPSVGLYSDEGGQVIGDHTMNSDNRLKTAAGLSKLWDGAAINRTRTGSPLESFPGRRTSLRLMIQPRIAKAVLTDQTLRDQGLLSRT